MSMRMHGDQINTSSPLEMWELEKLFNHSVVRQWSKEIRSVSIWISGLYVILVFTGQQYMRHRPVFEVRMPLVVWNLVLALFSIVGTFRTIPELVDGIQRYGWMHSICSPSFYHGQTGIWAYAFVFSKVIELGDTGFIVLRKQPLVFLHWYHHVTVFIYCFYSYPEQISSGRWFMVMNYCIHSLMYSYYMLRALRVRVPKFVSITITSLQIVQMIGGLTVAIGVYMAKNRGDMCHQSYENVAYTILMYLSYFILFIHFFYQAYFVRKESDGKSHHASNGTTTKERKIQ